MKALRMEIWRYVVKLFSDKNCRIEFGSDISIKRSGIGVVWRGRGRTDEVWNDHLDAYFKKIKKKKKKPRTRKKYRYVTAMSLELAGELLHPSHISALKHMHVRRYSCLALFYFIFSNSYYSIMNHLMLFVFFCLFFFLWVQYPLYNGI